MRKNHITECATTSSRSDSMTGERGAALATSLIVLTLLACISMTVLAVVTHEARIAGSDLQRTQTFYAAAAGMEKMTADFCSLFAQTSRPTTAQINNIAASYPTELINEGFTFSKPDGSPGQLLTADTTVPTAATIDQGPFAGLIASVIPYTLDTTAIQTATGTQVRLQRKINNYLVPIFQFGMFSNDDLEVHPGPAFAFNGRVHANGNLYINGAMTFLSKVSTANELVVDVVRNGTTRTGSMSVQVGAINVPLTMGSVNGGPYVSGTSPGMAGYFPGSPSGTFNTSWTATSVTPAAAGQSNRFGGQVITRSTGGSPLLLPMQLEGNQTREIIKRMMPNDNTILSQSRYHAKSQVRILIDDESPVGTDAAGIPAGQGLNLSTFDPVPLPNLATSSVVTANGGGRALWRVNDVNTSFSNSYNETATSFVNQQQNTTVRQADTVRGVRQPASKAITGATKTNPITITCTGHGYATGDMVVISNVGGTLAANGEWTITVTGANTFTLNGSSGSSSGTYSANTGSAYALRKSPNGTVIPNGAGLTGRILIQIVDPNGVARDVTQQILSMGVTQGEPNAIVHLQRPVWTAFTQGSRDSSTASLVPNPALNGDPAYSNTLTDILNKTHLGADGEIKIDATHPLQDSIYGFLTQIVDNTAAGVNPVRADAEYQLNIADWGTSAWNTNKEWNSIVPINVYNVREGRINSSLSATTVYDRGITSVVELNMRNLARWLDGVYNNNLLAGTNAVSGNIGSPDGYTVYVSDRRGDKVKAMVDSGVNVNSTNGMVDNEDIYGPNGTLDDGEDVQQTGAIVKDVTELPDPAALAGGYGTDIFKRALTVAAWSNLDAGGINHQYFRNSVRIFNGENLQVTGGAGLLSATKGITISSENMVYIWGNYNTTGINTAPPDGVSCLNDNTGVCHYLGNEVPSSIVCDAYFPLSKTFFDAEMALYPDNLGLRLADRALPSVGAETSVRAAILAGNNLSALANSPDAGNSASNESRLNGGMHNFPRFLENWGGQRFNFVGSLIPLYHSTQAVGQYNADSTIYSPPTRDWAFDITFTDPNKLPPGTPLFQHIEPTGFKQIL
jgi:Tfp pilus assembly protein PilX